MLVAEASRRRVVLHGRHAEVGEDDVGARLPVGGQHGGQGPKAAVMGHELVVSDPLRAQACDGARQFQRIAIEADQATARPEVFEQCACVPAAAECAVHGDVAGARPQVAEDFRHHDGPVRLYFGRAIDHATELSIAVAVPVMASPLIVPFMS